MARMPATRETALGTTGLQKMSAFTNRMERYRLAENVGTWRERGEESRKIKGFIMDQLPDRNSQTTEFLPSLTSAQRKQVFDLNRGQFGYRSRYEQSSTPAPAQDTGEIQGPATSENHQPVTPPLSESMCEFPF